MRLLALVPWMVLVSSCAPVREPTAPPPSPTRNHAKPAVVAANPDVPSRPLEPARATHQEISGIVFEGVAFDARSHRLIVADQTGGPASQFADAAAAGEALGGLAAVNGGFFTPEGAPLGLVIAAGKSSGTWNSGSSLGSGLWIENASGQASITRRETLGRAGASGMRELLQAGPMLVESGHLVSGLDTKKHSVRTLILWDGSHRWWMGRTSACSLAGMAAALTTAEPAGWPVHHALNLDGGRSADLWISSAIPGGPISRRPPWNRPVRNFLILRPR
jgi:hypothetical protein